MEEKTCGENLQKRQMTQKRYDVKACLCVCICEINEGNPNYVAS
uniref:Uncharacterized protein n=1 Tax=Rhizophora mucronata TaxID=61149 RepID=A0A2P2PRC6_RHIMU